MIDLIKNGGYKDLFKIAKLKTQLRKIPKVYQIPEVFPKGDNDDKKMIIHLQIYYHFY